MPKLREESYGSGDQTWLGSTHGITNAQTATLDRTALTAATHYPQGYLKSGFALAKVGTKFVPYNAAGSGGTNVLAGFLLFDVGVLAGSDPIGALLDHGRVKLARLPFTVAATATTTGQFVFV